MNAYMTNQPKSESLESSERTAKSMKYMARIVAILSLIPFLLARDTVGPPYLDNVAKAVFWTGMVLVPLIGLNQDVLRSKTGKIAVFFLVTFQLALASFFFRGLSSLNFIFLSVICIGQILVFALPLMFIRKQQTNIWY
jgi:hypothetical protein